MRHEERGRSTAVAAGAASQAGDASRTVPLLVCPWPRKKPQPGDMKRLGALLEQLDLSELPSPVCWVWPDRKPEPVKVEFSSSWLAAWARDRQVVLLAFGRLAA
jgi:hypothetical protein